jgi:hypothetical protein
MSSVPPIRIPLWEIDLADWPEHELAQLKVMAERRQANYERIIRENLIENVHFGVFSQEGDEDAVIPPDHPYLYPAGASRLREILRHHTRHQRDPVIQLAGMIASVTCEVGVYTLGGRLLGVAAGHANTREKWWRRGIKDWKYDDPCEVVPGLLTKAEARAARNATLEALNLRGIFANVEEHQRIYQAVPIPEDLRRWDAKERRTAKGLIKTLGMKPEELERLVCRLFGRPAVGTGAEAQLVVDTLTRILERRTRPAAAILHEEVAA